MTGPQQGLTAIGRFAIFYRIIIPDM